VIPPLPATPSALPVAGTEPPVAATSGGEAGQTVPVIAATDYTYATLLGVSALLLMVGLVLVAVRRTGLRARR
jgi:hypothetical protein